MSEARLALSLHRALTESPGRVVNLRENRQQREAPEGSDLRKDTLGSTVYGPRTMAKQSTGPCPLKLQSWRDRNLLARVFKHERGIAPESMGRM